MITTSSSLILSSRSLKASSASISSSSTSRLCTDCRGQTIITITMTITIINRGQTIITITMTITIINRLQRLCFRNIVKVRRHNNSAGCQGRWSVAVKRKHRPGSCYTDEASELSPWKLRQS